MKQSPGDSTVADELEGCYRALELEPGASLASVRRTYRQLVKIWHPDQFTAGSRMQEKAQERLKEINLAYERLAKKRGVDAASDPARRNQRMRPKRPPPVWDDPEPVRTAPEAEEPVPPPAPPETGGEPPAPGPEAAPPRRGRLFWAAAAIPAAAALAWVLFSSDRPAAPPAIQPAAAPQPAVQSEVAPPPGAVAEPAAQPARPPAAPELPQRPAFGPGRAPDPQPAATRVSGRANPLPPETAGAAPREAQDGRYFTVGSRKDEVVAVQGAPDSFTDRLFQYGSSLVSFRDGRVVSWRSDHPPLRARLPLDWSAAGLGYFTIGSRKDEVIAVQGLPDAFTATTFQYGSSAVFFRGDRVESWRDGNPRLKARVLPVLPGARPGTFAAGATKSEVVSAQGMPDSFTETVFRYGTSAVYFENGRVKSWTSAEPVLKVRAP